jgi:excinuclease ABC subunit A
MSTRNRRASPVWDPRWIDIRGAREHNLKNLSLRLPRGKLIVVTGVSGSGKSSLAFDTLYAEGQRRYVESLSAYARQFLGQLRKPDADHIQGLSPAIAIEQRTAGHNPRSTVATVTEIYDYLRVLYARVGVPYCPVDDIPVGRQTIDEIVAAVLADYDGARVMLLAPIVQGRKGEYRKELESLRTRGFVRVRIDGEIQELDEVRALRKGVRHTIETVVDRLTVDAAHRARLTDSLETGLRLSGGWITVEPSRGAPRTFSERASCVRCGRSLPDPHPRNFSFNSPYGACPTCQGLGVLQEIDPGLVVVDPEQSVFEGALAVFHGAMDGMLGQMVREMGRHYGFDPTLRWRRLSRAARERILRGSGGEEFPVRIQTRRGRYEGKTSFEGVIPNLERRYKETHSSEMREWIARLMAPRPCPACGGGRLRPESLAVRAGGLRIHEFTRLPVRDAAARLDELVPGER